MIQEYVTTTKTRIMYALTSLGVATIAEGISGIMAFYFESQKINSIEGKRAK
jgi:hypothetical protein